MKYYVVLTITFNDETKDSVAIYTYEDSNTALASFHTYLGSWMKKENAYRILCMMISDNGGIYKNEVWYKPEE